MSVAADPRGFKRICTNCGTRFYDMNKRPIQCPSCDTEFTGEVKVKGRRGRIAAVPESKVDEKTAKPAVKEEVEDEIEEDTPDVEEVSLDDVKADEDSDDDVDGDDDDIDLDDDDVELDDLDDVGVLDSDDDDDDDLALDVDIKGGGD